MHCPKCKAELKDGTRFCSKCGGRVDSGADREQERDAREPEREALEQGRADREQGRAAREQGGPAMGTAELKRQEEASRPAPASRKGGQGLLVALLALLLVLVLAGGVGAFLYLGNRKDQAVLESVRSEFAGEEEETGEPEMEASGEGEEEESGQSLAALAPTEASTLPQTEAMPTEAATAPQTAAMPTGAPQTTAYGGQGSSQDEKIQYIRDAYNRIVANLGSYRQEGTDYYDGNGMLVKSGVSGGNAAIDNAMRSNGYTTYSLEYYYDDQYAAPYPIFIFAVIDGKEYRYYFEDGNFIRRVGPEGSVNDNPEMNAFITTLRDEGYVDREG